MGKFVINKTPTGFNFYLKASNGETIGTSEVYQTKSACESGISSVVTNSALSSIEDTTIGDSTIKPKFQIYKDNAGKYRFRLLATNGENILASEGYESKESCKNGISSVKANCKDATVVDNTKPNLF